VLLVLIVMVAFDSQWWSQGLEAKDSTLKTKNFKIVLEDEGRGLVLEDSNHSSNTGKHRIKCFGEAPNTLHIYSVIANGHNSKLLQLKSFVQNMQWLVKSVSSSFSEDLSHEPRTQLARPRTRLSRPRPRTSKLSSRTRTCPRGLQHCWQLVLNEHDW